MDEIRIAIISDVVCPWCYIGKRRLERALAARPEVRFSVEWQPFELHPDLPVGGVDRDQLLAAKFGGRANIEAVFRRVADVGREEGIDFHFERMKRVPNTSAAHAALHWSRAHGLQDALAEGLFHATFVEGHDIGDHEVLARLASGVGLPGDELYERLSDGTDLETVRAEARDNRRAGVSGVPYFVLNERYAIPGAQPSDVMVAAIDALRRKAS
jgi:predicted DsbA family dithiol-disulfide isomerase